MRALLIVLMVFGSVLVRPQPGAAQSAPRDLIGTWYIRNVPGETTMGDMRYELSVNGNAVEIIETSEYVGAQWGWIAIAPDRRSLNFHGRLDGQSLAGTVENDWRGVFANGQLFTRQFTGMIGPGGRTIHVEFMGVGPRGAHGNMADAWSESPAKIDLRRE